MDCLLIRTRKIAGENLLLAGVCDGVGSTAEGGTAASTTLRLLLEWFDALSDTERIGLRLRNALLEINETIRQTMNQEERRAATTASVLLLRGDTYYLVHIGDSRIYLLEQDTLMQLTVDQSEGGKLTQYIGQAENLFPQYGEGSVSSGLFLLCSDGLFKRVQSHEIQKELHKLKPKQIKKCIENLADCAIQRGEADNITIAIVMIER